MVDRLNQFGRRLEGRSKLFTELVLLLAVVPVVLVTWPLVQGRAEADVRSNGSSSRATRESGQQALLQSTLADVSAKPEQQSHNNSRQPKTAEQQQGRELPDAAWTSGRRALKLQDRTRWWSSLVFAVFALVGIILSGLLIVVLALLWGRRVRRCAWDGVEPTGPQDDFWFLKAKGLRLTDEDGQASVGGSSEEAERRNESARGRQKGETDANTQEKDGDGQTGNSENGRRSEDSGRSPEQQDE